MSKIAFGEKLYKLRGELKLSKIQLAEKLGFKGEDAITCLESGAIQPDCETLVSLAKIFQVDLNEFLTGQATPAVKVELENLRAIKHEFRMMKNQIEGKLKTMMGIFRGMGEFETMIDQAIKSSKKAKSKEDKTVPETAKQ